MVEDSDNLKDSGSPRTRTETPVRRKNRFINAVLSYLTGPRFLVYASCALSIWGDRMWHFAMSVFLIELYGHNLLLTAVFGLVVAGSVLVFGALIGDWIDRKPRNKVAHASLFIQNSSVTACCVVLMLVFSYKTEMEQMWHGWFTVFCYAVVIILADLANLASTALTITIQKDWIVVITGENRGQLAGMNAAIRRMDQVINIFAPLSVGQVMTWASNVIGCGFILGWNLISLLVEFIFLSRVYQLVPPLAVKPQQNKDILNLQMCQVSRVQKENNLPPTLTTFITIETQASIFSSGAMKCMMCERKMHRMLCTCRDGWKAYYRQSVFLAGLGLAFLYTTVLGFDCITTGYAYTQGISGSLLSILMALSAFSGLMGTILFTKLRKRYGLAVTGIVSSLLHVSCLMLCVFSVFAPGSPFDLGCAASANCRSQLFSHGSMLVILSLQGTSSRKFSNFNMNLFIGSTISQYDDSPESSPDYVRMESWSVVMKKVMCSLVCLWSFDLTVTQLLQENIPESERGIVNGVQSSMNYLMDLVHFIMVILAPQPQQFGLLVIISLLFVITGHVMYFIYAKK
uniref:Solute carrier family 40 member n=1 Tax=Pelodiscus sinensis TaxID=13735 RepID=K7FVN1_PELSI